MRRPTRVDNSLRQSSFSRLWVGIGASLILVWLAHQALLPSAAAGAAAPATLPGVISLWGGARSSVALKSDGSVWTFGANNCGGLGTGLCGKLGDGTIISRSLPVQVHGPGDVGWLDSITAIMAGEHENYALKADGTLWAWGGNFMGQLGDGTFTNTVSPVQVSGLVSVTKLGGRGYHNLAVTADGTIWAWGSNSRGQLGHDTSALPCPFGAGMCSSVPVPVVGISNPLTVTGGGFFSLAIMQDYTLQGWGENTLGELADGTYTNKTTPVHSGGTLSNVIQVSGGWKHAVALTADHQVWTWGDNTLGQIGSGVTSTVGVTVPYPVPGLGTVIAVSGGDRFTAALKPDGTVWAWGWNGFGQLGDGTYNDHSSPMQVHNLDHVIYMAARDYHMLVIKDDGTVWTWGSGTYGELGNGVFANSTLPVLAQFASPSFILDKLLFLPLTLR